MCEERNGDGRKEGRKEAKRKKGGGRKRLYIMNANERASE